MDTHSCISYSQLSNESIVWQRCKKKGVRSGKNVLQKGPEVKKKVMQKDPEAKNSGCNSALTI